MSTSALLRAAVLGASGIGRYHVRELIHSGAEVVAIQGSSAASAARTAERLRADWGVRPRACTDLDEVLALDLDLVCIATPHELHFDAALRALARKLFVFCEKPLVWRPGITLDDARAMLAELAMAGADGRLSVNTSNATFVRALSAKGLLPARPSTFRLHLATAGDDRGEDIAVDLLPHALSLVRALVPDVDIESITGRCEPHRARFAFRAGPLEVDLCLEEHPAATKRMHFTLDDVEVERVQEDVDGEYRVFLRVGPDLHEVEDPFRVYLREVLEAVRGRGALPVSFDASGRILLDGLRLIDATR
jgi:predicted dehydrogenase